MSRIDDVHDDACKDLIRPGLCARLKTDLPSIKEQLRARHPLPDFRQLRRARLPIYTSMHMELCEDGFTDTAQFLESLVEAEDSLLAAATEGLRLHRLSEAPGQLEALLEAVKRTEGSHDVGGSLTDIVNHLLQIASEYVEGIADYQWVAESVLLRALREARKILTDYSQSLARVLFFVGKFFVKIRSYADANIYLKEALIVSDGKDWIVSKTVNIVLYNAICAEFCGSLNSFANEILTSDPGKAKALCDQAVEVAKSSRNVAALANAYSCYGHVLIRIERFDLALQMFEYSVEQRRSDKNLENLCRSELELADCLFLMKKVHEALRHSRRAYKTAHTNDLKPELGDSYAMMAKCERNLGVNNWGAENYIKAVEVFNELGELEKTRRARCYAAIALAQGIITPFTETALKSDKERFGDNRYMAKLLDWKLSRAPFWECSASNEIVVSTTDTRFSVDSSLDANGSLLDVKQLAQSGEEPEDLSSVTNSTEQFNQLLLSVNRQSGRKSSFYEEFCRESLSRTTK